jgi:hypothetical protein
MRVNSADPYLRPKILVMIHGAVEHDADVYMFDTSSGLAPIHGKSLPKDDNHIIRTLVSVDCSYTTVGTYVEDKTGNPYPAQRHSCHVHILDVSDPSVTVSSQLGSIPGPDPPQQTTYEQHQGTSAIPSVVQHLRSLSER